MPILICYSCWAKCYSFHFADVVKVLEDGDLQTLGLLDYDKRLAHSFTAHPKVDPFTGENVAIENVWLLGIKSRVLYIDFQFLLQMRCSHLDMHTHLPMSPIGSLRRMVWCLTLYLLQYQILSWCMILPLLRTMRSSWTCLCTSNQRYWLIIREN